MSFSISLSRSSLARGAWLLAWLGACASGCTIVDLETGSMTQALEDPQGRDLLGSLIDEAAGPNAYEHVSVNGTSAGLRENFFALEQCSGASCSSLGAAELPLTVSASSGLITIQGIVDSWFQHDSLAGLPLTLYQIEVSTPAGIQPLCSNAMNEALVVPGRWGRNGTYIEDPLGNTFTFACRDESAVAKCIDRWGYLPDTHPWQFRACTRMARADYCGLGESHTFDGTVIDLYDSVNLNNASNPALPAPTSTPPLASAGMYVEAGWIGSKAICLGKLRWQTLPLGGPCPSVLPDPRVPAEDQGGTPGYYCDDSVNGVFVMGALTANSSMYNDRGLYRWRNASGDQFTTTRGLCDTVDGTGGSVPAPGFRRAVFLGTVLGTPGDGRIMLRSWLNGAGERITTAAGTPAPQQATDVYQEGYVFAPDATNPSVVPAAATEFVSDAPVELVQLWSYDNASGKRITNVAPLPAGATSTKLEGWILMPDAALPTTTTCSVIP